MKKLLFLLLLLPSVIFAQYDAEHTAHHIMKGEVRLYLKDTTKLTIERKPNTYNINCSATRNQVKTKLDKILAKGNSYYEGSAENGYIFTIAITSKLNKNKVLNYCTFHISMYTQRIEEVEILLPE